MDRKAFGELVMRLFIPTVIMAAALWYLGSLWNARMREQNLVLILPTVVAMVPFYFWVIAFELNKYRAKAPGAVKAAGEAKASSDHLLFMALSVVSVVLFYLLGAVPATLIAMVLGLFLLGVRRPILLVLVPALVTLVLWIVFVKLFGVAIPLFLP